MIFACFGWYGRLYYLIESLEKKGYDTVLYVADFDHIKKEYITSGNQSATFIHVPEYKSNLSLQRVYSHYIYSKKAYRLIREKKPDLIYTVVPPNLLACYAGKYKRRHSETVFVMDVIDLWPESFPVDKYLNNPLMQKWRNYRTNSSRN